MASISSTLLKLSLGSPLNIELARCLTSRVCISISIDGARVRMTTIVSSSMPWNDSRRAETAEVHCEQVEDLLTCGCIDLNGHAPQETPANRQICHTFTPTLSRPGSGQRCSSPAALCQQVLKPNCGPGGVFNKRKSQRYGPAPQG